MNRWPIRLCAALWVGALAVAAAQSRDWTVPNTRPGKVTGVQYSDEPVIPCRRIGFRTKSAALDVLGPLRIYPVVRTPRGQIYRGFVRRFPAKGVGDRWLFWSFPPQFRSPQSRAESELSANYGDSLADTLDRDAAKLLPSGDYQVKWVINDRLVDTGDHFAYAYRTGP